MGKRTIINFVAILALIAVGLGVLGILPKLGALNAQPAQTAQTSALAPAFVPALASAQAQLGTDGVQLAQTFTLHAGWNTIYLEVEPVNTSPLVNIGTEADPIMVPEQSTLETVFAGIPSLESVWSWNVPQSRRDYIVDPAEGLWDEPGWKRYFPESTQGADGVSQAFLTDLLSLHANTAYLVKLDDNLGGTVTVTVTGQPVVRKRRWVLGSYNLAGFQILPGATPTVDAFFAGSPVSEVNRLTQAGEWVTLAGTDTLAHGQAYLAFYDDGGAGGDTAYTAPLGIVDPLADGMIFTSGTGGNRASFTIENFSPTATTVDLSWVGTGGPGVALRLTSPVAHATSFNTASAQIPLAAGQALPLRFAVLAAEQLGDGAGFLQISAPSLGVRWLVPVTARSGSRAGLWIGEATVNDVSEGRLGGTNVDGGLLTVALRQRNQSGVLGAVNLQENRTGASVAATVTLAVPAPELVIMAQPAPFTTSAYLSGYLYVDLNQNGERDGDEPGLVNIPVRLDGSTTVTTTADGFYRFQPVAAGVHTVVPVPVRPAGFTNDFAIVSPGGAAGTSSWPERITTDATGVTQLVTRNGAGFATTDTNFPRYDVADNRMEPSLNFGFVSVTKLSLWTTGLGGCGDRLELVDGPWPVKNGALNQVLGRASLNPPASGGGVENELLSPAIKYALLVESVGPNATAGPEVACGEIVVGAPTSFADGSGSEFTFRVILRVHPNGRTEILPSYTITDGLRVSSPNFSMRAPVQANGRFTDSNGLLDFGITIPGQDPLNPYKHKYSPDHDNLDAKFNPYPETLSPYLWESFEVRRRILLSLTDDPPLADPAAAQALAIEVDWGGAVWGGLYQEVVQGVHKNPITVKGYFIIQHTLTQDQLIAQSYD